MLTELAFDSGVRFGLDLASGRLEFHEALRAELRERLKSDVRVERLVGEWLSDEGRTADKLEELLWQAHSQRYLRTAGTISIRGVDRSRERVRCESAGRRVSESRRSQMMRGSTRSQRRGELEPIINQARRIDRRSWPKACPASSSIASAVRQKPESGPAKRKFPDEMPDEARAIIDDRRAGAARRWTSSSASSTNCCSPSSIGWTRENVSAGHSTTRTCLSGWPTRSTVLAANRSQRHCANVTA